MPERKKMFSDSWHLVAERHACLKAGIETSKQHFRGERWYVLKDPFRNEFFRVTDAAYQFLARLRRDRTIEDVWRESMEKNPDEAPGQEEVVEILGQLNQANLIQSDIPANSSQLFQQYRKNKNRMTRMQALNFLFFKIPIFNPDRMLEAMKPIGALFASRLFSLIWLGVIGWALKAALENWDTATTQSAGFLSPQNLPFILACTIFLKAIHELAHGVFCKHHGGQVHTFGIMLMVFAPLPYVDATSSWGFREKSKRMAVSAAGMYAELFIAAIATLIWAETGRGTVNAVAYNVMVVASVTTVLFNINPLLKFDGYYLLSDFFGLVNLQQRANRMIQFLYEYGLLGYRDSLNPSRSNSEGVWLVLYGLAAALYRIFLMLSIAFLVATQFFEIGLLIACFTIVVYIIVPVGKYFKYIATNRQIQRQRTRAWTITLATIGLLVVLLGIVPAPSHFSQPGIVLAAERARVHAQASGRLEAILTEPGIWVAQETPLFQLRDDELDYQERALQATIRMTELRIRKASEREAASLPALQRHLEMEQQRLAQIEEIRGDLLVRAPISGYWVAPELPYQEGSWLHKGMEVGRIVGGSEYRFVAVISQQQADNLFTRPLESAQVRLWGEAGSSIAATVQLILQAEQLRLPSPALGWLGGGQIEVDQQDPDGTLAVEPFFTIIAALENTTAVRLLDEKTGRIRVRNGSRPLALQWYADIRKLLQKRLKL